MSVTVFCESCGQKVPANARFCEHCGATLPVSRSHQDPPTAHQPTDTRQPPPPFAGYPPPPPPFEGYQPPPPAFDGHPAAERIEALTPGAGELASQLAAHLRTPAVATALIAGGLAAAAVFGIGVLLAVALSDQSFLGIADQGKGAITGGFAQMLNFLQVSYSNAGGGGKLGPALFVIFPVGGCAVAAATQARRTRGLPPLMRLLSGASVGLVFGLLMLIPALATGSLGGSTSATPNAPEPSVLGAVLLGILWGAIGGLLGTSYVLRRELSPGFLGTLIPRMAGDVVRTVVVAIRPLAVVLALMTAAGTITWTVETLRSHTVREGRSTVVATVDDAAFAVEHGVHWTELGAGVQFRMVGEGGGSLGLPIPTDNSSRVKVNNSGAYRIFGFHQALPAYTFIPLLIWLFGVPLLLALYAGFAVARVRRATAPIVAAAWGALVGPIWAITMVIVNALVAKDFFGRANGGSVFGMFLIAGAIAGAVGGLLVTQSPRRQAGVFAQ